MKLHLGVGDVYLGGYVNVDIEIPGYSFLAIDRPDLVDENITTFNRYYKLPYTTEGPAKHRLCVCDLFMDLRTLTFPDQSVDEILLIQTLEHFSPADALQVLRECYRVLCPDGRILVDVPDFEVMASALLAQGFEAAKEYYYRMIFGSQKNPFAVHRDGYSEEKLCSLLQFVGFVEIRKLGNVLHHPYTSLTVEGYRA
jgi:SAM-dependent methyltransferase